MLVKASVLAKVESEVFCLEYRDARAQTRPFKQSKVMVRIVSPVLRGEDASSSAPSLP